jgi:hypothetical protein
VTGVQTCALPICLLEWPRRVQSGEGEWSPESKGSVEADKEYLWLERRDSS